jgi:hypothetical protein
LELRAPTTAVGKRRVLRARDDDGHFRHSGKSRHGGAAMTKPPPTEQINLAVEIRAIRRLQKSATAHAKRLLADIVEIGKRLDRVKERVGHGNYIPWLKKNFGMSADTAENYVAVFRLSRSPEFRKLRNLPLDILYLLGRKSTPPETVTIVARRVEAGEPLKTIRAEIRQLERCEPLIVRAEIEVERDPLKMPEPTAEQLANRIWNDVIDIMSHGLQTDWRERLDASLSALEPAQARDVRELLGEKVNAQIKRLSDQLERLRAADDYLRTEKPPRISLVPDSSTKH